MPKKGYISEMNEAGRINSHGKIESLAGGFRLKGGLPFSLYARPKSEVSTLDTTLLVQCTQDRDFAEAPLLYNDWSPLSVVAIAEGQDDVLSQVDLYWGCGTYVKAEDED